LRPRIALFFFAVPTLLAASAVSGVGSALQNSALLLGGTAIWALWFGLMFLIAVPRTNRLLENQMAWLKRGALVIFILLAVFGLSGSVAVITMHSWFHPANSPDSALTKSLVSFEHGFAYNDATALCHQAAENLLKGENPYAHSNIVSAALEFGVDLSRITALREGEFAKAFPRPETQQREQLWNEATKHPEQVPAEFESKVCYPAGCFLIPLPFLLMGIADMRLIYLIFVLAAIAYVIWFIPGKMKLVFAGGALISLELWKSIANGETGVLVFSFLLIAWALAKKRLWISAVFMGLAIATKQTAWFYLPFYLILLFREIGLKKLIPVMATIGGIFLAVNIPFIAADPKLWFTSVMSPMLDNLFPTGVGIITLVLGEIWNIQSPMAFGLMEAAVFIAGIVWYFHYYRRYPSIGPVLAILPLFFAWRSWGSYFFYAALIMLAGIMINEYGDKEFQTISRRRQSREQKTSTELA
jgi:hypothetical protein